MSTQARFADLLLRDKGYGGLWEWAMDQRRTVRPPGWPEVAARLTEATDGEIRVGGDMLRKWLLAAEEGSAKAGDRA